METPDRFDQSPDPPFGGSVFDRVEPDILQAFPDLVRDLSGDPGQLLRQAGIDLDAIGERRTVITYRQSVDLVARAAEHLQCTDFGMRLAARQAHAIQTPLMHVLRHARTLGEAWELVTTHSYAHSLAAAIRLRRFPAEEIVMLGHDILLESLSDKRQAIEQILLVIHLSCRDATGGFLRPHRVEMRHQPMSSPATYRRYFGCDVRFGQAADALVYREDVLSFPIVASDPLACRRTLERIDVAYARHAPPLNVTVRGLISDFLGSEHCTNDEVARALAVHRRTMHRRLGEEGTSFQRIKDAVRRDRLVLYLEQTDLPLSSVSERLGFAEQSAMTRFCRKQLGCSPSERRGRGGGLQGSH